MGRDLELVGRFEEKLYQINTTLAQRLVNGRDSSIDEAIKYAYSLGWIGNPVVAESVKLRIREELPLFVTRIKNESSN